MKRFRLWFRYNRSIPEMYFCLTTFVWGMCMCMIDVPIDIQAYVFLVSAFAFCGWSDKLEFKRLRMRYYALYSFSSNLYDKAQRIAEEKMKLEEELSKLSTN